MIDSIAFVMMLFGAAFLLIGTIGILRFRDVFLRLHAASKSLTFGFGFFILGASLLSHDVIVILEAGLAVLFQFITAPISAQMIARAALRRGIRPLCRGEKNTTSIPNKAAAQ